MPTPAPPPLPQNVPPANPQNPAAGAPPAPGLPSVGTPLTPRDVANLRARRDELSTQLGSAESRRRSALQELRRGPADEAQVQQRITLLDNRILQIENDLAETGKLLATAPAGMPSTQPPFSFPRPRRTVDPTPIAIVFTLFVLAPLAIGYVWRAMRRPTVPPPLPGWAEHLQRMDRVEQAVDTIAIEIERISEGQRFLTKILAENSSQRALGAGPMEQVPLAERDAVRVKREA